MKPKISLLDISPVTESVDVAAGSLVVRGVSAGELGAILGRFPGLLPSEDKRLDVAGLVTSAPAAAAAFIAASCGFPGDERAERLAGGLSLDDQLTVVSKALELTMPGGLLPFVERLTGLMEGLGVVKT